MDNYEAIVELLQSRNIVYREQGEELVLRCLFSDCDVDSHGAEAHLYINKHTGLYDCKKCGEKGNLTALRKHFGTELAALQSKRTVVANDTNKLAAKLHSALPVEIWEYLNKERLLRNEDIEDFQLGYMQRSDGHWITIPVTDRSNKVLFFKLRRSPFTDGKPKYKSTGGDAAIFNAQVLKGKPEKLVICEGEFDCLVLHGMGIPTICSTAGVGTFKDEWVKQLDFVRDYYVVTDNDEAGRKGADSLIAKLAAKHPNSSIMRVTLPPEVGEHGDITDYFKLRLGTSNDLFEPDGKYVRLAAGAQPIDVADFKEMSLKELADVLSLTIKQDDDNKLLTFLAMLSAYTDSSQINVSFNAPSSSGKTYIATEIAKLFPAADKIERSGASPTSFYYGEGVYVKEIDAKMVLLERKILIFYEQPNPDLQARLRPVLSHDQRELQFSLTNKDKKGAHRAEKIIIRGYPATVFCSAGMRLDEQEATRAILLSPEVTAEKLQSGIHLQAQRGANEAEYESWLESQPERIALKNRILAVKRELVGEIIIDDPEAIEKRFKEMLSTLKPRNMRDMAHLLQLIKVIALLNVWFRKQPEGKIVASANDVEQAFELWGRLMTTQELNLPPAVMQFYLNYIVAAYELKKADHEYMADMESGAIGLSIPELNAYYLRHTNTPLNNEVLRKQVLPQLENSGVITVDKPSKKDKRSRHIWPKWFPGVKTPKEENNIGTSGGKYDIGKW